MTRLTVAQARKLGLLPPKVKKKRAKVTTARWDAQVADRHTIFIIPENTPSLNVWKRWHWSKQREYLQYLAEQIAKLVMFNVPKFERARVEVTHYYRVFRKRDPDNQAPKFILDALRYAGVIAEDNSEVLELPEPEFMLDRQAWRTEVKVIRL